VGGLDNMKGFIMKVERIVWRSKEVSEIVLDKKLDKFVLCLIDVDGLEINEDIIRFYNIEIKELDSEKGVYSEDIEEKYFNLDLVDGIVENWLEGGYIINMIYCD
jgi:hypothetical protein